MILQSKGPNLMCIRIAKNLSVPLQSKALPLMNQARAIIIWVYLYVLVLTWHRSNSQLKDKYKGPLSAPTITAAQVGYTLHPAHNATVPKKVKKNHRKLSA